MFDFRNEERDLQNIQIARLETELYGKPVPKTARARIENLVNEDPLDELDEYQFFDTQRQAGMLTVHREKKSQLAPPSSKGLPLLPQWVGNREDNDKRLHKLGEHSRSESPPVSPSPRSASLRPFSRAGDVHIPIFSQTGAEEHTAHLSGPPKFLEGLTEQAKRGRARRPGFWARKTTWRPEPEHANRPKTISERGRAAALVRKILRADEAMIDRDLEKGRLKSPENSSAWTGSRGPSREGRPGSGGKAVQMNWG